MRHYFHYSSFAICCLQHSKSYIMRIIRSIMCLRQAITVLVYLYFPLILSCCSFFIRFLNWFWCLSSRFYVFSFLCCCGCCFYLRRCLASAFLSATLFATISSFFMYYELLLHGNGSYLYISSILNLASQFFLHSFPTKNLKPTTRIRLCNSHSMRTATGDEKERKGWDIIMWQQRRNKKRKKKMKKDPIKRRRRGMKDPPEWIQFWTDNFVNVFTESSLRLLLFFIFLFFCIY